MNMVRRRILEDPGVTNDVLFAAAIEIEPEIGSLNARQFNARYPLRVRRWELSERTKQMKPVGALSVAASLAARDVVRPSPDAQVLADSAAETAEDETVMGIAAAVTDFAAPAQDAITVVPTQIPLFRVPVEGSHARTGPASSAPLIALQEFAVDLDSAMDGLPLESATGAGVPVQSEKVEVASAETRARRRRAAPVHEPPSDRTRSDVTLVLLRWATLIGQAGTIPEVFAALATIDEYVDRIATILQAA
jgi:hypothetical protein